MKKLALIVALLALLAAPLFADRVGCNAAMATATCKSVCRSGSDTLWFIPVGSGADAKLTTALAKKAGWTATVTCTQAMVDAVPPTCTAQQLNTQVANPTTEVQAAKAEFKRWLKDEFIRSLDAESLRATSAADLAAALAAIADPDMGD